MNPGPIRLGVVCDYLEERWASMDLVAEMVLDQLARRPAGEVAARAIRPAWQGRLDRLPLAGGSGLALNADRVANRYYDYPKHIRTVARSGEFDLYHLIDHSYAQLVPELPAGRAVVTCHDLNAFRCLLEPAADPRPRWFRALARRTLDGFRQAAAVACNSEATRRDILRHDLLPPERLRVVHIAVHPSCSPEPDADADARARDILGPPPAADAPEILHVGTSVPRKRIDVLLNVFARIKDAFPAARLVKVGGRFAPEHQRLAESLGVAGSITFAPYIEPAHHAVIAAIYRRAAITLLPSDHEGFGIPAAEAMACGAAMLASDLPVLREVGGEALLYRPVGDLDAWSEAAVTFLRDRHGPARQAMRAEGLARASRYTWTAHVDALVEMYRDVLDGRPAANGQKTTPSRD